QRTSRATSSFPAGGRRAGPRGNRALWTRFGTSALAAPASFSAWHPGHFISPASLIQPSLCWHERRSALVLDQDHQEFRRLGTACVPVNDMNIVGAFIEGLSWCQCYLFSTLHLQHNGALQHVNNIMRILP